MKKRVWIFEDDFTLLGILTEIVKIKFGYEVQGFSNPCEIGNEFDIKIIRNQTDIVITDIRMPKMTGIELATHLILSGFNPKNIAIISGLWTDEYYEFSRRFRIQTFSKPVSAMMLIEWLQTRRVDLAND